MRTKLEKEHKHFKLKEEGNQIIM